ncbi:unnamed protein product [Rotaria sp. Silwood2]|nr:unnamed protein product [Rotaria sp. Silwood2]
MFLSTSLITKSPPLPSSIILVKQPIIRQSSIPIQSMMVTQIHSILNNIDSVLDKIQAQANSIIRRSAFNENYSSIETSNTFHLNIDFSEELQNTTKY